MASTGGWVIGLLMSLAMPLGAAPAEYYVSKSGSDSGSGAMAQPFATVRHGVSRLSPGDTLYIRGGTYHEGYSSIVPPSGTSWDRPVTIKRYQSESVIFAQPPFRLKSDPAVRYVVFDGLTFDCQGCGKTSRGDGTYTGQDGLNISGSGPLKFIRVEIKNASGNAVMIGESSPPGTQFLHCKVHGWGSSGYDHAFYIMGRETLIEDCDIFNGAGSGIKFGQNDSGMATGNIARKNRISRVAQYGHGGMGILFADKSANNLAYNNVISNIQGSADFDCGGIQFWKGESNAAYHNTIHQLGSACFGINVSIYAHQSRAENNIIAGGGPPIRDDSSGAGTDLRQNLCATSGRGCAVVMNPQFVNAGAGDVRLQAGSPAIDLGQMVRWVTDDADGMARPHGDAPDLGAFEYGGTREQPTPTAPHGKLPPPTDFAIRP